MTHFPATMYILMALFLLLLPLDWVLSVVFAGLFHELCHVFAVYAMNGRILRMEIRPMGCILETGRLDRQKQFISILAGPMGSLALLFLSHAAPKVAVCGLVQGIFNLLPVYPLDGGRLLALILQRLFPENSEIIRFAITVATFLAIDLIVITLAFSAQMGFLPVLFTLIWNIRLMPRKIPCKPSRIGVQ